MEPYAEVRAQYRFLETIINTVPSLLAVVDTEGRFRNFNRAVESASGLDDGSRIQGAHFWDVFISRQEREAMIDRFREAAPDYPEAEYENTFRDANDNERVIAWRTAPLLDENGNVVRIVAGGLDITDRKRRELDLQRQRDFANTVANTIPSYILITDQDGVVVPNGANRAFCDMLGGAIDVRSQLGVGTMFTVRLPYTDPHELSISRRSGSFSRTVADAARAAALRAGQVKV